MVREQECGGAGIWEHIIPSDTGRVVRDAFTPQVESCAFIDVASNRSTSLSDFFCRSEKPRDHQV